MITFDDIVFGPVASRRLGRSLGINLLPCDGKICNFDCIYCECGWNKDSIPHASSLPSVQQVVRALENTLSQLDRPVDSITFSGNGEPTLHPDFPEIVRHVISLRDKYCPSAVVSVLSNATGLDDDRVVAALKTVDNPILKLDAPSDALACAVNRPQGKYSVENVINGMKKFDGNFILQTMFLYGAALDYTVNAAALNEWMDIIRQVRPRLIMAYSLDREAPMPGLAAVPLQVLKELLKPLADEGYNIQINAT